jgi:ankyrin repeat protein
MSKEFVEAVANNDKKKINELISFVDVNYDDDHAISRASAEGNLNIVKLLVSYGADIHVYDDEPLRNAASHGYIRVIKYLVSQGANIHAHSEGALLN